MRIRWRALLAILLAGQPLLAAGLWDIAALQQTPQATWGGATGLVQQVYYEGEPFHGKPTRVFAYYGRPAEGQGPFPAVLLVHGGGGKAFPNWAEHWAKRGYVALAMDLAGNGPDGRLEDGGPDQSDASKFREFTDADVKDMWTYHAVAAVIRGHSLLASRKEVDPNRIAVTGISWGGYLTCIVAGLDDQLKAAVPVYGCGFLHENSCWLPSQLAPMTDARRNRWVDNFDPSRYLGAVKCPMLFVNGTCDFAYPLDSYQKSYRLVKTPVTLSIQINRPHGHIWTFPEVDAFIDHYLTGGKPLPTISAMTTGKGGVLARFSSPVPVAKAELNYTTVTGPWQKRQWRVAPAAVNGVTVSAALPAERPLVYYLRITDERGLAVTAPHAELPANESPWTSLFDGKTLAGWVVKCKPADRTNEFWKVGEGSIAADSMNVGKHDYVWLLTEKEYSDFVLRLKFQAFRDSPGNSGVQVRSRYDDEAGWLDGPQVDINPPGAWRTGMIWDETRESKRWLWPVVPKGQWVKPEMANPQLKFFYSDDANPWNDLEISATGLKLKAVLNGVTVMDYDGAGVLDDAAHKKYNVGEKGHIALQIHTGDRLKIRFKEIQIKTK